MAVRARDMPKESLDSLYAKVVKKTLTETLHLHRGDSVTVETWDSGLDFARRAVAEARAIGCTAVMIYEDEGAYVEGVRRAPEDLVGKMGKNEYGLLAGTDAYVFIPGQALGAYSKTLKPEERERSTRYNSSWYEAASKAGLRGARLTFGYVGKDLAGYLGKKRQDVVRAQLAAALVDYGQIARSAGRVSPLLTDGAKAELRSGRSSLTFTLQGELSVEDGMVDDNDVKTGNNVAYVPPGFVSKDIAPDSANGTVTLSESVTKVGVVHGAQLEFREGRLISWESEDRAKLKNLVEALPAEKRRAELLTVGLNPAFGFGWGQDRFVEGSLTLAGFGLTGVVKKGALSVAGSKIVADGRLTA